MQQQSVLPSQGPTGGQLQDLGMSAQSHVLRVVVGANGRLCTQIIRQYLKKDSIIVCSRDEVKWLSDKRTNSFADLATCLKSVDKKYESVQIIFAFRSRSIQSLDHSMSTIINLIDQCHEHTGLKISIAFLNSVCSIRNEFTQSMYYHFEKALMSRAAHWFSADRRILSSVDIIMHRVPKDEGLFRLYIDRLVNTLELSRSLELNGAQINFSCPELHEL